MFFFCLGTYYDAVAPDGQSLSDYMLLCSVVATILVIVNTAQVCIFILLLDAYLFEVVSNKKKKKTRILMFFSFYYNLYQGF